MKYRIDQLKCSKCGMCADECPHDCIYRDEDKYIIDEPTCGGCGVCAEVCQRDAIFEVY